MMPFVAATSSDNISILRITEIERVHIDFYTSLVGKPVGKHVFLNQIAFVWSSSIYLPSTSRKWYD